MNTYVGLVKNRLKVLAMAGKDKHRCLLVKCQCHCGNVFVTVGAHVAGGYTRSCGCSRIEHGHRRNGVKSPTHNSWNQMLDRCRNPHNKDFRRYGGNGVKVCRRWYNFKNFIADLSVRPSGKTSLGRLLDTGDYKPGNAFWQTRAEQETEHRKKHHSQKVFAALEAETV